MLKNILIKSAELLNRIDIIDTLKTYNHLDEITDSRIAAEIRIMIDFYNQISTTVFEDFLELTHTDIVSSDNYNKIQFYNLSFFPSKIISLTNEQHTRYDFKVFPCYIFTHSSNKIYHVTYRYIPNELNDISSKLNFPNKINKTIFAYGIVSEYLASKNLLTESKFWREKFLHELFKNKSHKERRIKSTFKI